MKRTETGGMYSIDGKNGKCIMTWYENLNEDGRIILN
jgi:hypothetical protein